MDTVVATGIAYEDLVLAKNIAEINVDPADLAIIDRSGLRYYLQLQVRPYPNAGTWEAIPAMDGVEEPPELLDGASVARGAFFSIEKILNSYVETSPPVYGQKSMLPVPGIIRPFRYIARVENNGAELREVTSKVYYAIAAGLSERDFPDYGKILFSEVFGQKRRFLTYCPINTVLPDQDVYMYFLNNLKPAAQALKLRMLCHYTDGSEDEDPNTMQITLADFMNVYSIPVGPQSLGISEKFNDKTVHTYEVWLLNEDDEIISEIKSFRINREVYEKTRTIIFRNSLGGYDSVACVGRIGEALILTREAAERFRSYEAPAQFSEVVINKVTGERELTVNTGWISADNREWLSELALSEEIYVKSDRDYLPLKLVDEYYPTDDSKEYLAGRTFIFTYTNKESGYSRLPARQPVEARPTAWRPYGEGACQLDAFGKRTGKRHVTHLEKYYPDSGEPVKPATVKLNSIGTEGYHEPVADAGCDTTPFLSAEYVALGTFRNQTCAIGYYGNAGLITIAAERWGSETDQEDADRKAQSEWASRNTQAYANQYGPCILISTNGLLAKYYRWNNNPTQVPLSSIFSGSPAIQRFEDQVALDGSSNLPVEVAGEWHVGSYAASWEGYIKGPVTGMVTFRLDNNKGVRLYINGVMIINYWENQASFDQQCIKQYSMHLDQMYRLRVEHFKFGEYGGCEMKWSYTGQAEVRVPAANFFRD